MNNRCVSFNTTQVHLQDTKSSPKPSFVVSGNILARNISENN